MRHHQTAQKGVLHRGGPRPPRLEIILRKREKNQGHRHRKCKDTPETSHLRREKVQGHRPQRSGTQIEKGATRGNQRNMEPPDMDIPLKEGEGPLSAIDTLASVRRTGAPQEGEEGAKRGLLRLPEPKVEGTKVRDTKSNLNCQLPDLHEQVARTQQ